MKSPKLSPNNLVVRRTGAGVGCGTETGWDIFPQETNTDISSAKRDYNYKLLRTILWRGDKINVRNYQQLGLHGGHYCLEQLKRRQTQCLQFLEQMMQS